MNIDQYIVAETDTYIVVNKPTGMSSVDDKTGGKSLQFLLENKYKRPLHAITRIDKVVSGLCLFALSSEGAAELSKLQSKKEIAKEYLAIVEGDVKKKDEHLTHFLRKQGNKAKVSNEEKSNFFHSFFLCIFIIKRTGYSAILSECGNYYRRPRFFLWSRYNDLLRCGFWFGLWTVLFRL